MTSLTPPLGPRSIFHLELYLFVVLVFPLRDQIPTHIRYQILVLPVGFEIDIVSQIIVGNNIRMIESVRMVEIVEMMVKDGRMFGIVGAEIRFVVLVDDIGFVDLLRPVPQKEKKGIEEKREETEVEGCSPVVKMERNKEKRKEDLVISSPKIFRPNWSDWDGKDYLYQYKINNFLFLPFKSTTNISIISFILSIASSYSALLSLCSRCAAYRYVNFLQYNDVHVYILCFDCLKNTVIMSKKELVKWTDRMDECFIQSLLTQQDKGNRINGTFTSQAYTNMVEDLNAKTELSLTKSHLKNRLKTFKISFSQWYDMFHGTSLSGFGSNSETHLIEADDEVWANLIN
ncbi:hypothetical protein LXL04_037117 [Taraxacum kok-saghyz]